jgi:hypothetical protein
MRIRIRDIFDPGSGIWDEKKLGSGINIPVPPHCMKKLISVDMIRLVSVIVYDPDPHSILYWIQIKCN